MGNRVLVQFTSTDANSVRFSPVIYGHWHGYYIYKTIELLRKQMADRPGDIAYIAARLAGRMCEEAGLDKSTSVGIWNADHILVEKDSHGDAGIFLIDVSQPTWKVKVFAGWSSERGQIVPVDGVEFDVEPDKG